MTHKLLIYKIGERIENFVSGYYMHWTRPPAPQRQLHDVYRVKRQDVDNALTVVLAPTSTP